MRFAGKTVVITGAASGIGKATCLLFASEGATVIAGDIDAAGGEELAATSNGKIFFKQTDVCNTADIKALMDFAAEKTGGIDVVFNNAGAGGDKAPIEEIDPEGWDRTMNLLLRSVAMGVRYAVPHMIGREGAAIVNTASVAGLGAGYSPTAYAVAKCGVIHLTKVGATDLAKHNIRMNAICPGFVDTAMLAGAISTPEDRAAFSALTPIGRIATAEEVAATALFLASDAASYMVGVLLSVDGGVVTQ
jgi:NAD(P)-dependent dehydrogenase (short-subunit alcohol dehydrogenase family)